MSDPNKSNPWKNEVNYKSNLIPGKYSTNVTTCNETLPDGSVENILEDNAELGRKIVNYDIRL